MAHTWQFVDDNSTKLLTHVKSHIGVSQSGDLNIFLLNCGPIAGWRLGWGSCISSWESCHLITYIDTCPIQIAVQEAEKVLAKIGFN